MTTKSKKLISASDTITDVELAKLADVTDRRIRQLSQEGKLPPSNDGRFPAFESISKLIAFYRGENEQLRLEKLGLTKARREREELKLMREAGELCFTEQVQKLTDNVILAIRQAIMDANIPQVEKEKIAEAIRNIPIEEYQGKDTASQDEAP